MVLITESNVVLSKLLTATRESFDETHVTRALKREEGVVVDMYMFEFIRDVFIGGSLGKEGKRSKGRKKFLDIILTYDRPDKFYFITTNK